MSDNNPTIPADRAAGFAPPTIDPWQGFRGVMAGTLVLEAIVVAAGAFPSCGGSAGA